VSGAGVSDVSGNMVSISVSVFSALLLQEATKKKTHIIVNIFFIDLTISIQL